jgi:hypothetical protein
MIRLQIQIVATVGPSHLGTQRKRYGSRVSLGARAVAVRSIIYLGNVG